MESMPDGAPSYASWIGRVIDDRYRLDRVLGEGGMGAVFVAEHLRLRKEVAFKIVRPEIAEDPNIAARFVREAMATAQIESPHIASAIDYGTLPEGGAFLVTQLARGRSLSALLNEGPLPWPRAVEITAQIADALSTAHALGIIHRDLKPDNVIVGERDDGTPVAMVLDFGIAGLSHDAALPTAEATSGAPLTAYGLVIGTPGYMAPEQAVGDKVDARTDLYALGVILWESITGVVLWSGDTLTEMVSQQMRAPAPALQKATDVDIPEALEALVATLLARAPSERPESASAVRNELRALITATPSDLSAVLGLNPATSGGMPAAVMPAGAAQPTIPDGPRTSPLTLSGEPRDRKILGLLIACFVLGGALLIVAGSWLLGDDADADEAADTTVDPDARDRKSNASKKDKKPKSGKMSVSDDEAADGEADQDEFEVVERGGVRRLIRRVRR